MEGGNVLLSEAYALKHGLALVWEQGYRDVICNIDCGELLRSLEDEESRRFLPILAEISDFINRDWRISLVPISRDCNAPADWLAKKGATTPTSTFSLLEEPPSELEILLLRDRLAVV
ncbi:uncharacterized protein LOC130737023 [Lotus japonicus]|uniref:uncharacterized protein LOC130737023 n=1 Tax=Lotus japonicus TaxID=34305 RepID=UPI0025845F0B|nr:uncharacterized protein LOC130737023 [Lotus japonicus]